MKVKKFLSSRKLLTLMKIGITQTMIAFVICGVSLAHDNHAQVLDKEVTINASEVALENVLNEITDQTQVKFAYGHDHHLNLKKKVSIKAERKSLGSILNELLSPLNIKYRVHDDKTITLRKQEGQKDDDEQSAMPDRRGHGKSQFRMQVSGVVTTLLGEPLAGVNIIVKGTTNGTTTDADGRYSINAEERETLVFTFIGYAAVEVVFHGQTSLDVVMKEDVASMDEVIVNAGYYKTTKELQTGSIEKIEARDIERQPVSNPIAALQGRVPGLEVIQQNGVPGGNFKVRIRGVNSMSNGNDPLYIIDGVPYTSTTMSFPETSGEILGGSSDAYGSSPLNSINPSDIESIEVLKDADATSIYGSRGANGVILITTRKGKEGKTNVDVNIYSGMARVARKMSVLRTPEYLEMRNEAFENDEYPPSEYDAPDLVVWDQKRYTDWQEELIGGTATINDARLSVSGGDRHTRFLIGGGYHRETTVFPGSNEDQRFSMLSSISNTSANEKLTTTLSVNVASNTTDIISKDLTATALGMAPNAPALYNQFGNLNWEGWSSSIENPLAYLQRTYESKTRNLLANATVAYKIWPGLEAKVNIGFTDINSESVTINPISSHHPDQEGLLNQSVFGDNHFENWIVEPQLNWSTEIGKGTMSILGGATFLDQTSNGIAQYAEGFASEAMIKNLAAAPNTLVSTDFHSEYRYQAFFGRLNYAYDEKYVVNITARRDGSSRFGPGKQFAAFGAVGAAWIFSKENFLGNAEPFLSFGKLKASYGTTGNDQIGDYQFLNSYSTSGEYHGSIGLAPSRLYNPDFAWELNRKFEAGLDLGFVSDRITLAVNYYRNRSSNQLIGNPLAPTTGFTSVQANFPATVQNSGIELALTTVNLKDSKKLNWTTTLNITIPENRLLEFPDIDSSPLYANRYEVGQPLDIAKLYEYREVNSATGRYVFEDVNGDGRYDANDRKSIRFLGREFYGGFQNRLSYAGFELDFLFQFVKQDGFNYVRVFSPAPGALYNQPERVMERWTEPGQTDKKIQRFTAGGTGTAYAYEGYLYSSTAAVSDASFIRLKNLYLSYSLNDLLIQKAHLEDVVLFVQGQNLLTFTNHNGLDPENPGSPSLPPLRTFTAGIKLKI